MFITRNRLSTQVLAAAALSIAVLLFTSTLPGALAAEEPGQPSITHVFPFMRTVLIFYSPASSGSPATHHTVEVTSLNPAIPVQVSLQSTGGVVSLSGLEEAVDYMVSVTAFNAKGSSESAKTTFTTLGAAPSGPPTNVIASGTQTTITLSWQPPLPIFVNSKEGISQYQVKVKPSSESVFPSEYTSVSMATYTATDLKPGLQYDFMILAANEFGVSADNRGAIVTATTNEDVPSPPRNVTVVTQFTRALLYWRPPQPTNGQVTGYQVRYYDSRTPSDVKTINEISVSLSTLIPNLKEGAELVVQMRASTSAGWGPYSPTQRLLVVRQAVLEDTCAVNGSVVRMVFVYAPLPYPTLSHLGVSVYLGRGEGPTSPQDIVYSVQHPQNYLDLTLPSPSSGPLFWRYSVRLAYRGLEVVKDLSTSSPLPQLSSLKPCEPESTAAPSPSVTSPTSSMTTPTSSLIMPSPSITTPSPSVTTPTPSVATPTPSVTTPTPSVTTPPNQPMYCYNRTLTSEDCTGNDVVLEVRNLRRRKDGACSYRMKILNIRKGRALLNAHKNQNKNINIDFPVISCSSSTSSCSGHYSDGCVQLERRGVYLVGGALRVGVSSASLLPYLPRGFAVDRRLLAGSGDIC